MNFYSISQNKNIQYKIEELNQLIIINNKANNTNKLNNILHDVNINLNTPTNKKIINSEFKIDNVIKHEAETLEINTFNESNVSEIKLSTNELIKSLTQEDLMWLYIASNLSTAQNMLEKNTKTNILIQKHINWENIVELLQYFIDLEASPDIVDSLEQFKNFLQNNY